jgi:nucleotide-binding universal stress UspA family protein
MISHMFKRILVPVDDSSASLRGLRAALALARQLKARLRLIHLGNAIPPGPRKREGMTAQELFAAMKKRGEKLLGNQAALCRARGVKTDTALYIALAGRPTKLVVAEARKWRADLIVMGTHGRHGLRRVAMGSDAEEVSRIAPVPVLMIRK